MSNLQRLIGETITDIQQGSGEELLITTNLNRYRVHTTGGYQSRLEVSVITLKEEVIV